MIVWRLVYCGTTAAVNREAASDYGVCVFGVLRISDKAVNCSLQRTRQTMYSGGYVLRKYRVWSA